MKYDVYFVVDAEDDLREIDRYVSTTDSPSKAEKLLSAMERLCKKLETFPYRGHITPELSRIGVLEYREIHFHTYRIIYQIVGKRVFIHAILDGRRHLQELLENRLLRMR